jgi:hypothetical protein
LLTAFHGGVSSTVNEQEETGADNRNHWRAFMIRTSAIATFLFVAGAATAGAVDLKDLMPCKTAAARLCDRSQGTDAAALYKCGATLASRHQEVGRRCLDVLKRYGQFHPTPADGI